MKKNFTLFVTLALLFCGSRLYAQFNERTNRDIAALIAEKESRTPAQKKITSQLLQAIREFRGQKMAPGVELDPVNVNADAAGNLEIDIVATVSDELLQGIRDAGGKIISAFKESNAIRAAVNFSMIEPIAALPGIRMIMPAERAQTNGAGMAAHDAALKKLIETKTKEFAALARTRTPEEKRAFVKESLKSYFASRPLVGTKNSEGDRSHRTDELRSVFGFEGQGMRIGVLSDSYNATSNAPADVSSGNLPGTTNPLGNTTPVTIVQEGGSSDEGRAMLQIVHDLAPKAQLYFATGNGGQANFANNIRILRNTHNCDVIIDDLSYFAELVFQDGTVAAAVNDVTAAGAMYFSSCANSGSVFKGTAGVFEGDFNDNGATPVVAPSGVKVGTLHNFGTVATPQTFDPLTALTASTSAYYLKWSDPGGASTNDYDFFILTAAGAVRAASTTIQAGLSDPYEQIAASTPIVGDRMVVFKLSTAAIRTFHLNANRGRLSITTNGQTGGHSAAVDAYSCAATPASTPFSGTTYGPFPSAFNTSNTVESFSSDGPRRIFYNQNGSLAVAGTPTIAGSGGVIRNKPDITAADGVATTFSSASGLNPFYGTSASAPHAGAIAALLKSGNPALTAAQIRTALLNTIIDIETPGFDVNSGYGILNPFAAAQSIVVAPSLRLVSKTVSDGGFSNSNGAIDPGELQSRVVATLNNPSATAATSVTAVLSSPTAGITITQNTSAYGTLAPAATASNSAAPFRFNTDASVLCGSDIKFILTITYGTGGSTPQVYEFEVPVGKKPVDSISTALGATPVLPAGVVFTTGAQTGRIARQGATTASVCGTLKANPGLTVATGARTYDSYRFTNSNTTSQCVTVNFNSFGSLLFTAAYNSSGFVPTNPSTNFLADPGASGSTTPYAFDVAAGQEFTVVVHEVNPGPSTGTPYNLTVNFSNCAAGFVTVPVTLLSFEATEQSRKSLLTWKVANEQNVARYEVEYSADGRTFSKLFDVPATSPQASDKTYSKLHTSPIRGNNYYRIRTVDNGGSAKLSNTEIVNVAAGALINIAPNPAAEFATVNGGEAIKEIQLFSMSGQLIERFTPNANTYRVNMQSLAKGQYILKIRTASTSISERLIKE